MDEIEAVKERLAAAVKRLAAAEQRLAAAELTVDREFIMLCLSDKTACEISLNTLERINLSTRTGNLVSYG